MITRDAQAFARMAADCAADFGAATARAAFLVAPEGFARAEQSAQDNRYMADGDGFDPARALAQHRGLQRALSEAVPTLCFAGREDTPDAVFPNNVFATAPGRCIVGRMRHEVRRREAARADIRGFFAEVLGYREIDLSLQPHPCELTGSLVIDRARGLGYCGLSERCDEAGAALMHRAFGLRATLMFDLAAGEYHANVVLAVLGGRAALISPRGFADPAVAAAIAHIHAPHAIELEPGEHAAFAANAIALGTDQVWMSQGAADSLRPASQAALERAGLRLRAVPLDAIEAGGGSLRCCVGEIF
ncbi:amidinotransferase [Pseudoxanthomonas kalamensis DSM 18571]|uniref:arginine deiminase-related protein n=1 Tax=Pseudoxanthomonas kalamensis TaxID=289483 RepID=UPI0013915DD8|nr:arginine deiminase-related protein [Pseudoxanthomonas kalamensis]KAF1711983.1 amidinotransferase [Pseudoxanthomonas kalamensis DSM 18571]